MKTTKTMDGIYYSASYVQRLRAQLMKERADHVETLESIKNHKCNAPSNTQYNMHQSGCTCHECKFITPLPTHIRFVGTTTYARGIVV